ncbi:hypothetical protein [Cupriavidus sp. EM10]|uniref:hypothetical protein n=1 Tax=Cupriavidus sp. EM10 TaxID=2839983 RepID=UPI001C004237|nr:hypothetical protein [Cupriavidus sp. EM10]QWE95629.1 hypothetical protein KLP38_07255 [Cupriavidus sp. EM10]
MFEITNPTPAKLVNYNPRAEKHGKVKRPAATMRVQVAMPARSLDMLAQGLYDAIYAPVENADDMLTTSTRRFPKMAPSLGHSRVRATRRRWTTASAVRVTSRSTNAP